MKAAVRYQSRGGNTRAVAEVIAQKLGVVAYPIDHPIDEKVDVLFLGGGVYMWNMDSSLRRYTNELDTKKVGQITAFSTSGSMDVTVRKIKKYSVRKGIAVNENSFLLAMQLKGHSALGLKGGKLSEKQIKQIEEFVDKIQIH